MARSVLRYSVGNEHDPGDPWGRSELVVEHDGAARLEHYFSLAAVRFGAWTGRVDAAALEALWSALRQAGFPAAPNTPLPPGTSPRRLTIDSDTGTQWATVGYHQAASLPGYAEAFDILDAIVRQLSLDAVPYPTKQATIVREAVAARIDGVAG